MGWTDGQSCCCRTLNVGSGETLAKFIDDAVELYHDNVKKFETTASGVTLTGELQTTGFSSSDFAAFIVIEDGTDAQIDAGDNIIIEEETQMKQNAGDDLLMENVTSWVTSGFTIRDLETICRQSMPIVMTVRRPIVYDAGPGNTFFTTFRELTDAELLSKLL